MTYSSVEQFYFLAYFLWLLIIFLFHCMFHWATKFIHEGMYLGYVLYVMKKVTSKETLFNIFFF